MLATNANPFSNLKMQAWLVASPDVNKPPVQPAPSQPSFVQPKVASVPPQPQTVQPNPLLLLSSAIGFGNIASYFISTRMGANPTNATKVGGSSFVENTGWDEEYDPETGTSGEPSLRRRIPAFMHDAENPFNQSLNLLY